MVDIEVELPTLHADQVRAFEVIDSNRFTAIRCGRRWGKTKLGSTLTCDAVINGQFVGIFAPDYKRLSETFQEIADILHPVKRASSKIEGVFRTITGGRVDLWTLEDESAGRSRKYHRVIIDEAAFTKPSMMDVWTKSIRPTLLDYGGSAVVLSNTNGDDPENFFWRICNEPEHGFIQYHAPSHSNPLLPAAELAKLQIENPPLVYAQEYLAEFVSWAGQAFFAEDKLLVGGKPVEWPKSCDSVFAVMDTAVKTGKDNDGTAAIYCARSRSTGNPFTILDWDIVQIEGSLLHTWLPSVFTRLEELARLARARGGVNGVFIEDQQSGTILLQQARRQGLNVMPIESKLTAMGKDERAINVSGYVYQNMVKVARHAFEKIVVYKGVSRNHLMSQVLGFRIGDKDAAKRADDLLDCFTYGIALALGNAEGF